MFDQSSVYQIDEAQFVHFVRHYDGTQALLSLAATVKTRDSRVISCIGTPIALSMSEVDAAETLYRFTANFSVRQSISRSKS